MKNTQVSNYALQLEAQALATAANGGTVEIYSGTQPTDANTAVGSQTLGVTLTLGNPAFSVSSGTLTANAITSGTAVASITPTWCRVKASGGQVLFDGSVGTSNANLILDAFSTGASVSISSLTHTLLAASSGL